MESLARWICIAAALLGAARAQNLQLLGNSVVDQEFFVVGELSPGETLQQFTRRYRQQNPSLGLSGAQGGFSDPAAPRVPTAASSPEPLGLPSGATELLGRVEDSFSCEGLPYGYYTDPSNDCRVYHVCNPISVQNGGQTLQYSFFCNTGLEFDQQLLTCVPASLERSVCANARQFYESSNSQFFRDSNFNDGVSVSVPTLVGPSQPPSGGVVLIGVTGGVPVGNIQPGGVVQNNAAAFDQGANQGGNQGFNQGVNQGFDQGIAAIDQSGVNVNQGGFDQGSLPLDQGVTLEQSGPVADQGNSLLEEFGVNLFDDGSNGLSGGSTGGGSDGFFTDGTGLLDLRLGLPRRDDASSFASLV